MANVTKPPILDGTGQVIKQKLSDILAALQSSGGSYIPLSQKGAASGVAELDVNGKVPSSQLPSYVDDVLEYASLSNFPATGESGKIYIAVDTNKSYRWSGSTYVEISSSLALGETSSTAYRGDRGKTAYDHATESGKISAAVASGLYKIAATAQGHIAGLTAVQKSDLTALGVADANNIPTITDTYDGTSSDGMSGKAVKSAIDALDVTTSGAGAGKTLTALSQTDGKISATFGNISITKSQVSDFPTLATVATSGAYNDLSGKPTIPTVYNKTITIQKNSTTVDSFTLNQSTDKTINISVPTKTSDLTNDSGFVTTDEKITAEVKNQSSSQTYNVLFAGTSNQKPYYNDGFKYSTKEGSTSAVGHGQLLLGNSTASGTAGNKNGTLVIYSEKSGYVDLRATASSTSGRTITFPDKSGTVALTTDITTYSMTRDGESVKLTPSSGTAQSISLSSLINGLGEGTSPAEANDYIVCQYAGGGTTNTTYYRRKASNVINSARVKAALGTTSGTSKFLREDGTWQTVSVSWSGGTVSSNITPNADVSLNLGVANTLFSGVYSQDLVLGRKSSKTGSIYFYQSTDAYYGRLMLNGSISKSNNQTYYLPHIGGTLLTATGNFAVIQATSVAGQGGYKDVDYPSGFTQSNSYVLSCCLYAYNYVYNDINNAAHALMMASKIRLTCAGATSGQSYTIKAILYKPPS